MVAQAAVPLAMLASSMGLSIPAVIDYFKDISENVWV